jgi:hypothetical protein
MTVQLTTFDLISATFTAPLLTAVPLIEETYFKSLTTFPDSIALQRRVPPAGGITGTPPTTLGVGYELYVPQAVSFVAPAQNFQVVAAVVTPVAGGLVLAAAAPFATSSVPFIDVFIEMISQETNPYYRFGLEDFKIDTRVVDTTLAASVKDVNVGIPLNYQIQPNLPGIGKYIGYRFYRPFRKVSVQTDVLQIRVSVPQIGSSVLNLTPTGTYRVHVTGQVISTV